MIDKNFLLESGYAVTLYERFACGQPIVDYHNHLDPRMIAEDCRFDDITQVWLGGDHYKWRAMRANGVDEHFITGGADSYAKFGKWAETVQYAMRNPLYHWTHLELQRYFGITEPLNPGSARRIYDRCNSLLREDGFSVRGLLERMNVRVLCTTDDPADDLRWHRAIAQDGTFSIKVLPSWRPDKVMAVEGGEEYTGYISRLSEAAGFEIKDFQDLMRALDVRRKYFMSLGCRGADHGFRDFPDRDFTDSDLEEIFRKAMRSERVSSEDAETFRSGMIYHLAKMNAEAGWVQQFHIGAIRNNNLRLLRRIGPDAGCDSISDGKVASGLSRILGRLDDEGCLARTILYNLNPKDSETLMSMAYNFNDGSFPGKMQYGAAWWFLDQMDGIRRQIEVLSHGGLLSRFVGMLTDSRSFLSFPRHEYFRRILCNILGDDLEKGLLPEEEFDFIGRMVSDICYFNAKKYFNLTLSEDDGL